jgi:predicted ester cyclase
MSVPAVSAAFGRHRAVARFSLATDFFVLRSSLAQPAMGTMASATPRDLVERFYHEVWNRADERAARDILDPDFRFRASLGPELRGPDGFIVYLRAVHAAVGNFTCTIEDLVATPDRAAAKMAFRGTHRGTFFGVAATGRDVHWSGAAFFTIGGGRITELWVLGDIDGLKRQLMPDEPARSFSVLIAPPPR